MAYFVNVSTTATLIKTPGAGENLRIQNLGTATVFVSNNSGVTTTTGLPLTPGSKMELTTPFNAIGTGAGVGIYGITAAGSASISVQGIAT